MQEQANELVVPTPRPGARRLLRTVWAGAVATVTAGGLLLAAVPSVPEVRVAAGDRPGRYQEPIEALPAGRPGTVPQDVTPDQITAVLARADQQAREQGPDLSPAVAQAAAELGMLYTTYTIQRLALAESSEGLRVQDAPVARATRVEGGSAALGPVVQVSNALPAEEPTAEPDDSVELRPGLVTYHEVVLAAQRLANLLDESVPNALVEVRPAEPSDEPSARKGQAGELLDAQEPGGTLRDSLLDVVSMFGESTLEYANGRIPASVLCPLDFAPAHRLRCDAAERLSALNEEFEQEFGYPIPITDSYRPYVQQVAVAAAKPHLAAIPGTSNHGWGLAVDLGSPISGGASAQYVWLRVHGPDYGWDNPSWARLGGSKPEPWHFEFFAAGSVPGRAIDPSDVGTWSPADASEQPVEAAARDPRTKDDSAKKPSKPGTTPDDEPRKNPPAQKPSEPATPPKPSNPAPKPTPKPSPKPSPSPRPSDPSPKPTPSPTPTPSPSDPGEPSTPPSPSPSPSQPAPTPSQPAPSQPAPSPTPAPSEPVPSPSPSQSAPSPAPSSSPSTRPESLLGLAEDLGLTDDDRN
ncbi:D-alanyl-D-alanine carboxypeptidase family protein [Promicromonospora sp. NPDC060204]|uniref:M15 family metallopeptidase n=1 Tax=Promicromonospora sp. NPDC060204 TaxID=3347071 RepID=UPI003665C97D